MSIFKLAFETYYYTKLGRNVKFMESLLESMETEVQTNDFTVLEETVRTFNEANVVRMDKQTLKRRLMTQATLLAAKEANDALYQRYVKASKLKRSLRLQIQQKYQSKGKQKVREYLQTQKTDA